MTFNYAGIQFPSASAAYNGGIVRGFDDDHVVIGDGAVGVDDFVVAGSRSFTRDPRLASVAEAAVGAYRAQPTGVYLRGFAPIALPMKVDDVKWCYICGETKPKKRFSPSKYTFDRKMPHCMDCENTRNRARYAEKIGHAPRPYTRRSAAEFITGFATGEYRFDVENQRFSQGDAWRTEGSHHLHNFTINPLDVSA